MKSQYRKHRRAEDLGVTDDQMYQVDLVVTLFGVLVVLLLVGSLTHGMQAFVSPSPERYRLKDEEQAAFNLRSLHLLPSVTDFWFVADGRLQRVDLTQFARMLAEKNVSMTRDSVDVIAYPREREKDPRAFVLEIKFLEKTIPEFVVDKTISLTEDNVPAQLIDASYAKGHSVAFLIWPDAFDAIANLLSELRGLGLQYRMLFAEDEQYRFKLSWRAASFASERILR